MAGYIFDLKKIQINDTVTPRNLFLIQQKVVLLLKWRTYSILYEQMINFEKFGTVDNWRGHGIWFMTSLDKAANLSHHLRYAELGKSLRNTM